MIKKRACFFLALFFLFSGACQRESDKTAETRSRLVELHLELKAIHTRQDLVQKHEVLEKKILDLAIGLIALRERGLTLGPLNERGGSSVQEEILSELKRLYQIDGCQELIESAEEPALQMIDKYEHSREVLQRKRERSIANS